MALSSLEYVVCEYAAATYLQQNPTLDSFISESRRLNHEWEQQRAERRILLWGPDGRPPKVDDEGSSRMPPDQLRSAQVVVALRQDAAGTATFDDSQETHAGEAAGG